MNVQSWNAHCCCSCAQVDSTVAIQALTRVSTAVNLLYNAPSSALTVNSTEGTSAVVDLGVLLSSAASIMQDSSKQLTAISDEAMLRVVMQSVRQLTEVVCFFVAFLPSHIITPICLKRSALRITAKRYSDQFQHCMGNPSQFGTDASKCCCCSPTIPK